MLYRSGLAICVVLLAMAGPAVGQEIRPTLDKIKETGVIQLGYRETSRPFSFRGTDGQPAGFSVDLCQQVAGGLRESLKLPELKVAWVTVTPADRIPKLVKGAIDLECGSTTITFGRMEQVAFSHMISVDGGSLLATAASGIGSGEGPRRQARRRDPQHDHGEGPHRGAGRRVHSGDGDPGDRGR